MAASAFLTREMAPHASSPNVFRRAILVVSPTCEDMTALISAALDRDLPWHTRLRMRVHFLYCACCRRIRDHFRLLREACDEFGRSSESGEPICLDGASKEAMRRAIRQGR